MADYYSIIAGAVATLDPNTGEARRRIYERARGALSGETRSAGLPLDKSDILSAQMSLEEAIARVETEALRAEETRAAAQSAPRPVAPIAKNGRGSLSRLWAQMFGGGRQAERAEPRIAEPRMAEPRIAEPRIAESRSAETSPHARRGRRRIPRAATPGSPIFSPAPPARRTKKRTRRWRRPRRRSGASGSPSRGDRAWRLAVPCRSATNAPMPEAVRPPWTSGAQRRPADLLSARCRDQIESTQSSTLATRCAKDCDHTCGLRLTGGITPLVPIGPEVLTFLCAS